MKRLNKLQSIAASVLILSSTLAGAAEIAWYASSGQTPDQIGFSLGDTAFPENPLLENGILTLSTSSFSERMYYGYRSPEKEIVFPDVFEAAFSMKYISGSSSYAGRSSIAVNVTVDAYTGANLQFEQNLIFLSDGMDSRGPAVAIDTTDDFHDYVLRIAGTDVSVFRDGDLILNDSLRVNDADFTDRPGVLFGQVSSLAKGTSQWKSFSHNAAIPEPASAGLIALFAGGIIFVRRFFAD